MWLYFSIASLLGEKTVAADCYDVSYLLWIAKLKEDFNQSLQQALWTISRGIVFIISIFRVLWSLIMVEKNEKWSLFIWVKLKRNEYFKFSWTKVFGAVEIVFDMNHFGKNVEDLWVKTIISLKLLLKRTFGNKMIIHEVAACCCFLGSLNKSFYCYYSVFYKVY